MACCPGCKAGEECASNGALPVPVQTWSDESAGGSTGVVGSAPFTILDASIECRTKEYDARVTKNFVIA